MLIPPAAVVRQSMHRKKSLLRATLNQYGTIELTANQRENYLLDREKLEMITIWCNADIFGPNYKIIFFLSRVISVRMHEYGILIY